jgi:hypothetical protein
MPYQIELTDSKPILTAVIRSRVPAHELPQFVPAACGEVWSFFRSAGLRRPGRHVALYLEDGFVEVGAEVSEPFAGNERIHCSQLPGGTVCTSAPMDVCETRMRPFANGAPGMSTGFRVLAGRFTATGRRAGTVIHQKYAPMFSTCFRTQGANVEERVKNQNPATTHCKARTLTAHSETTTKTY